MPVGGGWGSFKHVFNGGKNIIYAVNQQGDLLWYRHDTAYGVRPRNRRSPNISAQGLWEKAGKTSGMSFPWGQRHLRH